VYAGATTYGVDPYLPNGFVEHREPSPVFPKEFCTCPKVPRPFVDKITEKPGARRAARGKEAARKFKEEEK